jgi:pSer/pThr/pTyr-binding forkhead associated (FHA) protein
MMRSFPPSGLSVSAPALARAASLQLRYTPAAGMVISPLRRDTPLRPVALEPPRETLATLTLMTGLHAGYRHVIDGAATTIGRAVDSDFVVDDEGVSRNHARIDRTVDGAFYVEDLRSTNGTYLGVNRIGIALLCGGDLLQLGPSLQVRFAILDSP